MMKLYLFIKLYFLTYMAIIFYDKLQFFIWINLNFSLNFIFMTCICLLIFIL